jgi:hypothetical protein
LTPLCWDRPGQCSVLIERVRFNVCWVLHPLEPTGLVAPHHSLWLGHCFSQAHFLVKCSIDSTSFLGLGLRDPSLFDSVGVGVVLTAPGRGRRLVGILLGQSV